MRRREDERGAVAILVAILCTVLLVMSAFVIDFGMAYVNKRQAQTAADAGVLAAAKLYQTDERDCGQLEGDGVLKGQAQSAAEAMRDLNLDGARTKRFEVDCNDAGELEVEYEVEYDSPVGIGQLVINTDHLTVSREAAATFDRTISAVAHGGMRPWPLCSNAIPADLGGGKVIQIYAGTKDSGDTGCPGSDQAGGWSRFLCPGEISNSLPTTVAAIKDGCTNPASPVPGQPTTGDPEPYLSSYPDCQGLKTTSNEFCLAGDDGGSLNNPQVIAAWQSVIAAGVSIEVPVFCGKPQCAVDAIAPAANGNKPTLPIHKIATVHLCGVRIEDDHGPTRQTTWPASGPCVTNNATPPWNTTTDTDGKSAFYLIVESLLASGDSDSGTQGGAGNVRLTK